MQESGSLTCQGAICKDKDKVCVPFDTNAGNAALIGIHKVNTKIIFIFIKTGYLSIYIYFGLLKI